MIWSVIKMVVVVFAITILGCGLDFDPRANPEGPLNTEAGRGLVKALGGKISPEAEASPLATGEGGIDPPKIHRRRHHLYETDQESRPHSHWRQ